MTYRADIDGLRALAVLLVLVFHFNLMGLGAGGFIGVDIFFVISGYLISSISWRELSERRFSLGAFYLRRIRRLAPALIVVQLAVLAFAAITLLPSEVLSLMKESFFVQTYLSNIYYWRSLDYFGVHASGAFMLHTWSLAVEEQFYLVFPLFLIAVKRWLPRRLPIALTLLFIGSFVLNLVMVHIKPQATFYLLPTRAWEMALGALIPYAEPWVDRRPVARAAMGVAAILLIVAALALHGPGTVFPGWFALLPTMAGLLFILAGRASGSPISRLLALPLPVWIGRLSYPLYLVHWPLHIFGMTLLPVYGLGARWALFGLSFVTAWLIYRFVERPVRRGAGLKAPSRLLLAYAASLGIVMIVVGSAWITGGWRGRFSPAVLRVADAADNNDAIERSLDYQPNSKLADRLRIIGDPASVPHWFVYGDSHAGALAEAFSIFLKQRGEAGIIAYHSGCLPVRDTGDATCRRFTKEVGEYVRSHREIGNVVLVSIWRQPIEPGFMGGSGQIVGRSEAIMSFTASLRSTLQQFKAMGAQAFVWEPLPAMTKSVPEAAARNMIFGHHWPTTTTLSEHRQTFAFFDQALAGDAPLIAGRMSAVSVLCPQGVCSGTIDGMPIFIDNNHPTEAISPLYASVLQRQLGAVPPAKARP